MKFLVLGAGRLGYALAYDLIRSPRVAQVVLVDRDPSRLRQVKAKLPDKKLVAAEAKIENNNEMIALMSRCDLTISSIDCEHNYELAKLALGVSTNFCDLGSDENTIQHQFRLDQLARQQNVTVLPNLGFAPGLVSILSVAAAALLDELYEIRIRFGSVPLEPDETLNLNSETGSDSLIDKYRGKSAIVRDGQIFSVDSLKDVEEIEFAEPFQSMEAFHIAGDLSNLRKLFADRISHLDYKAIAYPGHAAQFRAMKKLGMMSLEPISIDDTNVRPRDLLAALIKEHMPSNEPDAVLMRITVTGVKGKQPIQILWECVEYGDSAESISAVARMTGFPASIIAQMVVRQDIKDKGVLAQENVVPIQLFLAELAGRGIKLTMTEREPLLPVKQRKK